MLSGRAAPRSRAVRPFASQERAEGRHVQGRIGAAALSGRWSILARGSRRATSGLAALSRTGTVASKSLSLKLRDTVLPARLPCPDQKESGKSDTDKVLDAVEAKMRAAALEDSVIAFRAFLGHDFRTCHSPPTYHGLSWFGQCGLAPESVS